MADNRETEVFKSEIKGIVDDFNKEVVKITLKIKPIATSRQADAEKEVKKAWEDVKLSIRNMNTPEQMDDKARKDTKWFRDHVQAKAKNLGAKKFTADIKIAAIPMATDLKVEW